MKRIFIDPSYPAYENNKLFDLNDTALNRDDTLLPYVKFKNDLALKSIELLTYDLTRNFTKEEMSGDGYISLGNIRDIKELKAKNLKLLAFYVMESPLIDAKLYLSLPTISQHFDQVFVHNTVGDCYTLHGVQLSCLEKIYIPQPYGQVVDKYWSNTKRENKIVAIIGNHKPIRLLEKELYSQRIKWALGLNKKIAVDLFGGGWSKVFSRSSLWLVFLTNYFSIQKIYKGRCGSKLAVMSGYDYALCFENLKMKGYFTEKIFDCFYSGAIPIYLGGDDILERIPKGCFIDLRNFKNAEELSNYLLDMPAEKKSDYRNAAKYFLASAEGQKYYRLIDSLKVLRE